MADSQQLLASTSADVLSSTKFAAQLDAQDELASLRDDFIFPTRKTVGGTNHERAEDKAVYLCGNSLGLMSKRSKELIEQEMDVWRDKAVLGFHDHSFDRPWVKANDQVKSYIAQIVGAKESEVMTMNTLTVNLHLLLASFYKPTAQRYKILFEEKCFPSDRYMFTTQAQHHGLDPSTTLIPLAPRKGEFTLRHEDILDFIEREGDSIAIVLFAGVQYYTGQLFDMKAITAAGRAKGCLVGWDLAHAVGNVPLQLHDWNVDFAAWCTYKYLNSGPGGVGGMYIHERHSERHRLAGWFGQKPEIQFDMGPVFDPAPGAAGFQISTPSALLTASLLGSLETLSKAGCDISRLRARSLRLTGYLDALLRSSPHYVAPSSAFDEADRRPRFTIITPAERGAQLSLLFLPNESGVMMAVFDALCSNGVIGDKRKPDVIRLAPVPMYCRHEDVREAVAILGAAMDNQVAKHEGKAKPNGVHLNGHAPHGTAKANGV